MACDLRRGVCDTKDLVVDEVAELSWQAKQMETGEESCGRWADSVLWLFPHCNKRKRMV